MRLKRGKLMFLMVLGIVATGCNPDYLKEKKEDKESVNNYIACKEYLKDNFKNYKHIREMVKDSFELYGQRHQKISFHPRDSFIVDSLLLFNKENNRFLSTINVQRLSLKGSEIDLVVYIDGVKLDSQWYFGPAGSTRISRSIFNFDQSKPLTFEALSFIGRTSKLRKFYNVEKGKLEINHDKLDFRLSGRRLYGIKDYNDKEFRETTLERYAIMSNYVHDSLGIERRYAPDTTSIANEPPMTEFRRKKIDRYQKLFKKIGIKS